MQLDIKLLGGFQVQLDNRAAVFATDRARGLLAYLSVEADRSHRRAALAALVWPNRSERLAHMNFSQTLSRLRRAIDDHRAAPAFLLITPKTIQFHSDTAYLDVAHFEALLGNSAAHSHPSINSCPVCLARLETAASLYQGDFLQGFSIGDSQPFEEWVQLKREELHRHALAALRILAAHALEQGEYERAHSFAARQLALEPWREDAFHQLLQALAYSGQNNLALIKYQDYCHLVADELGMEPAPVIRELHERIRLSKLLPAEQPGLKRLQPPVPGPLAYSIGFPLTSIDSPVIDKLAQTAVSTQRGQSERSEPG